MNIKHFNVIECPVCLKPHQYAIDINWEPARNNLRKDGVALREGSLGSYITLPCPNKDEYYEIIYDVHENSSKSPGQISIVFGV